MKSTIIAILILCTFCVDAAAAKCVDEVPYYAGQGYGPGRVITSLFVLPTSLAVTIMTVPFCHRVGDMTVCARAACQPLYHAGAIYVARQRWDGRPK